MKKVLFVTLFAASASVAFAQNHIGKGAWMVGGTAGFSSTKMGDVKSSTTELAPNVGYFFINQLAGGLRANISNTTDEMGTTEGKTNAYTIAPFVRYYILPASQKINIFADASYGFGKSTNKVGTIESEMKMSHWSIMAGPAIFLSPSTALQLSIGYGSTKYEDVDDAQTNLNIGVGFQIHLGGKK